MTAPHGHPLRIHTKYHWMTFMLAGIRPKATINGYELVLRWGENVLPAPAGMHQVTVYVPYLWTFGRATATVDNRAASPILHYAAPVWTWQRGAIGPTPPKHPGLTATWIFYGVFFAALLICCIGAALSGGSGS